MSYSQRLQLLKNESRNTNQVKHGVSISAKDLNESEALKLEIHRFVIRSLGVRIFNGDVSEDRAELEEQVRTVVLEALDQHSRPLSSQTRQRITAELTDDILAYGPITPYLRDESISEVMVNGYDQIYIEKSGQITKTNARFVDESHLSRIIDKIVAQIGRRIDESSPMVDARLPDGSRVNAIIPPLMLQGSCLTIRKFRRVPLTLDDLISYGTLTPTAAQFLQYCVKGAANVLISGGTGSGKTTMLNVLSSAIPETQRIITIEDAAELQLEQEHLLSMESRPNNVEGKGEISIRDLVRNSLRMRPDRIIVGEVRAAEAVDMLQAMNTGHDGSMTTLHANSPREALNRIETLVLMAGIELPVKAIRSQICGAIDLVIQVDRLVDGTRRITRISEVGVMEGDTISLQDIFSAKPDENGTSGAANHLLGPLTFTGIVPQFLDKLASNGVRVPTSLFAHDDEPRASNWILGDEKKKTNVRKLDANGKKRR